MLLFEQSGILDLNRASKQISEFSDDDLRRFKRELGGAVGRVNRLWSNNYRYASEGRLRSHLHDMGLDRGIKGDYLKENLRQLLEASKRIIDRGILLWEALMNSQQK